VIRCFGDTSAKKPARALGAKRHRSIICRPQVEILEGRQLLSGTAPHLSVGYGQIPLSFEPNQGQTAAPVQFLSRGPGYTLFLTSAEAVLRLRESASATPGQPPASRAVADVLSMQFVGANAPPPGIGLDELPGLSNYLIGKDPRHWHINVPLYGQGWPPIP
jgi:hypothetical protein